MRRSNLVLFDKSLKSHIISSTMPSLESRPKVLRTDGGMLRVSNIRSDVDPSSSLSITVQDGDVAISITDSERGTVGIDLYPLQGGGANTQITKKFRTFARELADLIESGGE